MTSEGNERMRITLKRGLAPVVLLALLTACGGDDSDSSAATTAAATETTAAPGTTGAGTATTGATDTTAAASATTAASSETTAAGGDTGECTADKVGGTLTYGSSSQPVSLDPAKVTGTESTGVTAVAQIFDTLLQRDPDSGEFVGRIAESIEPNDDFTVWTLKLRDGVTFGNGDPFDATAVKASLERFSTVATSTYVNLTRKITAIDVVDPTTLTLTLDESWSGFPVTLALQPGMIVDTKVADSLGDAFGTDVTGAGAGAFELETYTAGEVTVLKAKPDYWDGPVCIEELRFVPLPADQARLESFQSGDFDVTWLRDPKLVEQTEDVPGFGLYVNASNVLLLNAGASESPANDVRIRQGLALALDTEAINDRANGGAGDATGAVIGEGSELTSDVGATPPDVDAAKALFDAAKAEGWDGQLDFICDQSRQDVAIAIQAQAAAAGVTLNMQIVPTFAALIEAVITNKNFDTACWGLNISDELIWPSLSNNMYSTSPSNFGGAKDAEMDAAIDDLRVATSDADVTAALTKIQERWNATVPSIVLLSAESRTIHQDDVEGITPATNTMSFFDDAYFTS